MSDLPPGFVLDGASPELPPGFVPDKPSVGADIAKSAGIGVAKGFVGLAGLPGDLAELGARGIDRATQYIGGKLGVDVKPRQDRAPTYGSGDIQKAIEGQTGEFYKPKTTAGEYAQTVGEFAPGLIGGGGAGALARRGVTQVMAPALASEAAGQYTKGTEGEPYARIAGAIGGAIAPSAVGRLVTPLPSTAARQRLVDVLADEGVTSLTAGQRTGRPALRYAESVLGDYPGAGSRASGAQQESQQQFTQAAMRRAGNGLPDATPEVLANNNARLGREFETLAARNNLTFDPQFVQDASQAIRNYERVPPSQQRAIVEGYTNDIAQHMQQGGMPGTYYQEMRSRLSRQSNGLRQSDPTLSETLRDLRNSLDDAMVRSISPADHEAWQTARREYGAQKTIEKAASRAGEATAEGQIVPANLRNAVASGNNRGAYARGEGQFSELARAGSGIMAPLPQSGTAPRALVTGLTSGLGGALGVLHGGAPEAIGALTMGAATPAALGRALMSRPVQGYLGNQVATPIVNGMDARTAAMVDALLATNHERGPLRLTVHPRTKANP